MIDVQQLLGLPDSTPNPHLWYSPTTMPTVAAALVSDLSALEPRHAAYFKANAARFDASLKPWHRALQAFAARYPRTPVATTEPVGDYMLQAAGTVNLTPSRFQADIMNGVDPAPQDVTCEDALFSGHRVKAFLYNQQVTDTLTQSFLADARAHGRPVVGVYETMPPRLQLPVVDARRAARRCSARSPTTSRREAAELTPALHRRRRSARRGRHRPRSAGRTVLDDVGFSISPPASSPG